MILIDCVIFFPKQVHYEDNLTELALTIILAIYAFALLLIACELCQRINVAFEECSDMIDQFKWYLFPDEIQRMLPTIFAFTQQPIEINCFGSTACNRESFKNVCIKRQCHNAYAG